MRFALATAAMASAIGASTSAQFAINEVRTGTGNTEYVEIKGTPGSSLAGITFLVIGDGLFSGETVTGQGVVEWKWTFGKSDVIGANGFLVLRNPEMSVFAVHPEATDVEWNPPLPPDDQSGFEANDNMTFMLVTEFTGTDTYQGRTANSGAAGQDLDTNDDGTLDVTPWTRIVDTMAIKMTTASTPAPGTDWWYSEDTAGPYVSRSLVQATTGTVVAGWDFQTTTNGGTAAAAAPNTPKVFVANVGAGSMFLDGTTGSSDWLQVGELNSFSGTATNANASNGLSTSTSGTASLALVNQTANTKSTTFKFSMTGIVGLNVSYATQRTSTGFTTQQWAWSLDGSSWTDVESISPPTSFGLRSLAQIDAMDNAADAYLRCTVNGASTATGNNRLDNIVLLSNPVTEDTIVTNYGAPNHAFKSTDDLWYVGPGGTTDSYDTVGYENYEVPATACGSKNAGACDAQHYGPDCNDSCCCEFVCTNDPYCCDTHWDQFCAAAALDCASECGSQPCPADLNLDGLVDGADLGTLLGSWNTRNNDLNEDGNVDGADLGILLGEWGPCD